jgi:putative solute:sodium symporter small subunit
VEKETHDYNISFFKPTTELARINRNLAIKLLLIWAVSVFGFHFLLRIIEEPTPEPAYIAYEEVWPAIQSGEASLEEKRVFLNSSLSVLGKLLISPTDQARLDAVVSRLFFEMLPEEMRPGFIQKLRQFEASRAALTNLQDAEYNTLKDEIRVVAAEILVVEEYSLQAELIPFELLSSEMKPFEPALTQDVPGIMAKYLIHNQSFLTDWKFLGFPFHYFYTAVFLLVLFIGLCWYYCFRTDRVHKRLGIVEIYEL